MDESMERAHKVFSTLCETLEQLKMNFSKNEDRLTIDIGMQGEDLPMFMTIYIHADRQLIALISHLPFTIPEDKMVDVAIATCAVNNKLHDGCFDYDILGGRMLFRMTSSFVESDIGNELFTYMLAISGNVIDDYNDKFLMLAKGMINVENFVSSI